MSSIVSIKEQNQVAKADRANHCNLFTLSGPNKIIVNYLELKSLVQLNYALGIPKALHSDFHTAVRAELKLMSPYCKALKSFQWNTTVFHDISRILPSLDSVLKYKIQNGRPMFEEFVESLFIDCCYKVPMKLAMKDDLNLNFVENERRKRNVGNLYVVESHVSEFKRLKAEHDIDRAYEYMVETLQTIEDTVRNVETFGGEDDNYFYLRKRLPLHAMVIQLETEKTECAKYIRLATTMIQNGFNIQESWDDEEHNVLMLACMYAKPKAVKNGDRLLIQDDNKEDIYKFYDVLIKAMDDRKLLNEQDANDETALHLAARSCNVYAFHRLWNDENVDKMIKNDEEKTAFDFAKRIGTSMNGRIERLFVHDSEEGYVLNEVVF